MNYGMIKNVDIANGIGVRISLFVSGCTHHCKDCFQPQTWNFDYGEAFTEDVLNRLIKMAEPDYIGGLSLLGGEPFEPENREGVLETVKRFKETYPDKTIWVYSGYTFEQLTGLEKARCGNTKDVLKYVDVLVDGEFKIEEKDISLKFKGSANQRIIDVKNSLLSGEMVLFME